MTTDATAVPDAGQTRAKSTPATGALLTTVPDGDDWTRPAVLLHCANAVAATLRRGSGVMVVVALAANHAADFCAVTVPAPGRPNLFDEAIEIGLAVTKQIAHPVGMPLVVLADLVAKVEFRQIEQASNSTVASWFGRSRAPGDRCLGVPLPIMPYAKPVMLSSACVHIAFGRHSLAIVVFAATSGIGQSLAEPRMRAHFDGPAQ
jgi:hypothetical protein